MLYHAQLGTNTLAQLQAATQTPELIHVKALLDDNKEQEALDYVATHSRQDHSIARSLNSNPYYELGVVYSTMGRTDDAKRVLETARAQAPTDAAILAYLGMVRLSLGEVDQSEKHYNSALAIEPTNESATIGLAQIRYMQRRWEDVIRYLESSRTANPGALYLLCDAYFRVGKDSEALITAQAIRSLSPNSQTLLSDVDRLVKLQQSERATPAEK